MVRTTDRDAVPGICWKTIVDRLDVGVDLTADRVGRIAVVAQEEHERLAQALLNDGAKGLAVDVNPRRAPGIVVAELCGRCSTERMTEDAHALQVEPSSEPA